MKRRKLAWDEVGLGDILADFRPSRQQTVHYLVVDQKVGEIYAIGHGIQRTTYYILQPLDIDDCDITLSPFDLMHQYSTWRKKA